MRLEELLKKIESLPSRPANIPTPPPTEIVAFVVRQYRSLRQWKVGTLADFAGVSISTVERIERGESVSEDALDRIAQAFGREPGFFTTPRIPLRPDKAFEKTIETYGYLEAVAVSPMKTHRAVREAAQCDGMLLHRPEVPESYDEDLRNLLEWIDLASFVLTPFIEGNSSGNRRELYNDVLKCIRDLERRGLTILSGVVTVPQQSRSNDKIALIAVSPKLSDPGATKRKHVYVDRRIVDFG